MSPVSLSIGVFLVTLILCGAEAKPGTLLIDRISDSTYRYMYENKQSPQDEDTYYMSIKDTGEIDNESSITNEESTSEEVHGEDDLSSSESDESDDIDADRDTMKVVYTEDKDDEGMTNVEDSGNSGPDVDMPDVYLVSKTKALKVSRRRGDMLKSCHQVELSYVTTNDVKTKVDVSESMMDKMAMLCGVSGFQENKANYNEIIFPGTKWCGTGDVAKDDDDVGTFDIVDKCCRAHDFCNTSIGPFESNYDLYNFAIWTKYKKCSLSLTRSECDCDEAFYQCLRNQTQSSPIEKAVGDTIGALYFNVLNVGCIQMRHPKKCVKRNYWGFCTEYLSDITQPARMMFVDNYLTY